MVQGKHQFRNLLAHVAVVTAASWAALGFAPAPMTLVIIGLSHLGIDWAKQRSGGRGFTIFMLDQIAHLVAILLAATMAPGAFYDGLWGLPTVADALPWMASLPVAMAAAAGAVATIWAGGYAVQALMSGIDLGPSDGFSLPKGGQLIGRLERLMILMLVLAGEASAIGFLIAAKSVLRFNEIARDDDRRVSEYVIIGTLASFAWALGTALATAAALAALHGQQPGGP
jgi:hypothetical protein